MAPPTAPVASRFAYASGTRPLAGYTIKRGIGHGGFGEVYYATSDAGKEVALKLIRRNWDVELRGVTQCLNLKHPNLLSLYDVKQDATGDNWVVMELMSGQSLEEVVAQHPEGLPLAETLAWIHGISAGVAYLHDHGIVHRDLKPGNIFVDEGIVKIGDYGLSKFMSCSRRSGQTGSVGTVHYMAPEIANGRYGKEIDIYALGIILYEMLTGHVPFEGESVGEILMKHLTAEPDLTVLSEPYRTIVSRALAKDPQRRFESVHELMGLLPPVPAGAALTAAARFAGPNAAVSSSSANAAQSAGYSMAPEIAAAQNAPGSGQTGRSWQATPAADGPAKPAAPEDPLLRWFHETFHEASAWWVKKNFKPWQKLLILVGAVRRVFRDRDHRRCSGIGEKGDDLRGIFVGCRRLLLAIPQPSGQEGEARECFQNGVRPSRAAQCGSAFRSEPAGRACKPLRATTVACDGKSNPAPLAKDFQYAAVSAGVAAENA